MKIKFPLFLLVLVGLIQGSSLSAKEVSTAPPKEILSIETGYTITKVCTALNNKKSFVFARS
ncbi:hypothetical protein [Flavobacterium faecale]|uniref:hypothetical protein n=1 Tax=Flavobacterium faecale TaxID=1355330 RepID=UPI00131F1B28|nr:hypothetical protein [Flavobacterium faecale]